MVGAARRVVKAKGVQGDVEGCPGGESTSSRSGRPVAAMAATMKWWGGVVWCGVPRWGGCWGSGVGFDEAFDHEAAGSGAGGGEFVVGVGQGAGVQGQAAAADASGQVIA